jgi:small conductance mechanosensitive channel
VLLDIEVAYGADIDRVAEVIESVAVEMARESEFRDLFLDDPQVWGVETLGSDSVAIRLVMKTKPGEQWPISREFRRRIKLAFDAEGIEIPFPQRTIWLRTDGTSDEASLVESEPIDERESSS